MRISLSLKFDVDDLPSSSTGILGTYLVSIYHTCWWPELT